MEFKDQLRIAREAKGWSQQELASKLGVSGQSVIWWELGVHEPKSDRLRKLEELLVARFNMTGNSPLEGEASPIFGVAPDVALLAQKITMLPLRHRNAIEALIDIGSEEKHKKSRSFIEVEDRASPKKGFKLDTTTHSGEVDGGNKDGAEGSTTASGGKKGK